MVRLFFPLTLSFEFLLAIVVFVAVSLKKSDEIVIIQLRGTCQIVLLVNKGDENWNQEGSFTSRGELSFRKSS